MARFGKTETNGGKGFGDASRASLIPAGPSKNNLEWHNCLIAHVKTDDETHEDKPRYALIFGIVDPGGDLHGAGWWEDFLLTDRALGRLGRLAKVTGTAKGNPDTEEWEMNPIDLLGRPVKVGVYTDEYNGKSRVAAGFLAFEPWEPEGDWLESVKQEQAGLAPKIEKLRAEYDGGEALAEVGASTTEGDEEEMPF